MLKLDIRLDNDQVAAEGKHSIESLYKTIVKLFDDQGINCTIADDGTYSFIGGGNTRDYGAFGRLITTLRKQPWFLPNVEKWLWYNSDDGIDENDYAIEDVLMHYTNRKSVA